MKSKIRKFLSLPPYFRALFIRGYSYSYYSYFVNEYYKKKSVFGINVEPNWKHKNEEINFKEVRAIKRVIQAINKYTPFENKCRHEAFTAAMLLKRRQIPYKAYVGFKQEKGGDVSGHVWTMVNNRFVTGRCNPKDYVIHEIYRG